MSPGRAAGVTGAGVRSGATGRAVTGRGVFGDRLAVVIGRPGCTICTTAGRSTRVDLAACHRGGGDQPGARQLELAEGWSADRATLWPHPTRPSVADRSRSRVASTTPRCQPDGCRRSKPKRQPRSAAGHSGRNEGRSGGFVGQSGESGLRAAVATVGTGGLSEGSRQPRGVNLQTTFITCVTFSLAVRSTGANEVRVAPVWGRWRPELTGEGG